MKRALCLLLLVACQPGPLSEEVTRTLRAHGFDELAPAPYRTFVCSDSDSEWASQGFTARNVRGEKVTGMVCCGLYRKGCTIRF